MSPFLLREAACRQRAEDFYYHPPQPSLIQGGRAAGLAHSFPFEGRLGWVLIRAFQRPLTRISKLAQLAKKFFPLPQGARGSFSRCEGKARTNVTRQVKVKKWTAAKIKDFLAVTGVNIPPPHQLLPSPAFVAFTMFKHDCDLSHMGEGKDSIPPPLHAGEGSLLSIYESLFSMKKEMF